MRLDGLKVLGDEEDNDGFPLALRQFYKPVFLQVVDGVRRHIALIRGMNVLGCLVRPLLGDIYNVGVD